LIERRLKYSHLVNNSAVTLGKNTVRVRVFSRNQAETMGLPPWEPPFRDGPCFALNVLERSSTLATKKTGGKKLRKAKKVPAVKTLILKKVY